MIGLNLLCLLFSSALAGDPLATRLPREPEAWLSDPDVMAALDALSPDAAAEARGWLVANAATLAAEGGRPDLGDALDRARFDDLRSFRAVCADVDAIRVAEVAYDAAFDVLVAVEPSPSSEEELGSPPTSWVPEGGLATLGWWPDGPSRGSYTVTLSEDPEQGFQVVGAMRLWSGRLLRCAAERRQGATPDADSAAFLASEEGLAMARTVPPPPSKSASKAGRADSTKQQELETARRAELARLLDEAEAPDDSPGAQTAFDLLRSQLSFHHLAGCGLRIVEGKGHLITRPREGDCSIGCQMDSLPPSDDLRFWTTAGDKVRGSRVASACAASPVMAWIPAKQRASLRPADLLGIVALVEPFHAVAAGDAALERRLRTLTRTMVRDAAAGRDDGLALQTWAIIGVVAMVAPEQKLGLLATGLAELGARLELTGAQTPQWPLSDETLEAPAALALLRETGGACVSAAEGPALAATLETLDPEAAMEHLIARCDAQGPDPLMVGETYAPMVSIFEQGGSWRAPEDARASSFWSSYWLARTCAEPVLGALASEGSPASREAASAARTLLVAFQPRRRVSDGVRRTLASVRVAQQQHPDDAWGAAAIALDGLSRAADGARLIDSPLQQVYIYGQRQAEIEQLLLVNVPELRSRCPDAPQVDEEVDGTMATGCPVSAYLDLLASRLYEQLQAEPDGPAVAAELRRMLSELRAR